MSVNKKVTVPPGRRSPKRDRTGSPESPAERCALMPRSGEYRPPSAGLTSRARSPRELPYRPLLGPARRRLPHPVRFEPSASPPRTIPGDIAPSAALRRRNTASEELYYASWCHECYVRLFQARRADIEYFARDLATRSRATLTRQRQALRGWNGAQAGPASYLAHLLEQIPARYGQVPLVLIGHSMGARAALRVAGHPLVTALSTLAPWLPAGEPAGQLVGRRVVLAHGTPDQVASPPAPEWGHRPGGKLPRQSCDGSRPSGPDKLLIRPTRVARPVLAAPGTCH
jgi:hypothetical protein